jgi:hypothetical protein
MDKFINRLFNNSPHEPETIFTSSVEKFKDKDSTLFKYAKRDKLINKDNPKKEKKLSFITVPVAENVSFEEASSMSLSFRVDNIKGKLMPVYVLENKADDTLSSVCTWQFIDGSEISEGKRCFHGTECPFIISTDDPKRIKRKYPCRSDKV